MSKNIQNRITSQALPLSLFINEKIFVKLLRNSRVMNTLLKTYVLVNSGIAVLDDNTTLKIDNGKIELQDCYKAVRISSFEFIQDATRPCYEKFVFRFSNHFMEQILERKLVNFDWSILTNVYKEALKGNTVEKTEITNGKSTIIYAIDDNKITLISGWRGNRAKTFVENN